MIVSARCSFRCSRRFSASSCFTRGSTGLGLGPRRRPRMSCKAPCSRCRRQLVSKDEYNPSRRNRAPSSPGFLQASACVRMRSRYSAGKRRRWAFAGTSGSGSVARDVTEGPKAAVALRAPSASAPSATSISTAAGMRVIHRTLPAPTLISPGRLAGFKGSSQHVLAGVRVGSSLKASNGVFQPRVFRGRRLSVAATAATSLALCRLRSVPLGKYWRSRPLVFSFVPRCHGLRGSQKKTCRPVSIRS